MRVQLYLSTIVTITVVFIIARRKSRRGEMFLQHPNPPNNIAIRETGMIREGGMWPPSSENHTYPINKEGHAYHRMHTPLKT